jgi:GPH family glycoside/pentoside/hexuronide:cation symporter
MSNTATEINSAYERLSLKEKIGYGMGDAGSCMIWSVLALYLTWFYTDVYGLDPAIVGTLFLVIRVFDAFSDPVMGAICDRTRTRWGKFRPWILWMAVPFGLGAVLMFTTPELSMNGKIIYAWVTYLIMSLIYTAINIPYCSVAGVITLNQKERMGCLFSHTDCLFLDFTVNRVAGWRQPRIRFPVNNDHHGRRSHLNVPVLLRQY